MSIPEGALAIALAARDNAKANDTHALYHVIGDLYWADWLVDIDDVRPLLEALAGLGLLRGADYPREQR